MIIYSVCRLTNLAARNRHTIRLPRDQGWREVKAIIISRRQWLYWQIKREVALFEGWQCEQRRLNIGMSAQNRKLHAERQKRVSRPMIPKSARAGSDSSSIGEASLEGMS